jgi:hypothetical protein
MVPDNFSGVWDQYSIIRPRTIIVQSRDHAQYISKLTMVVVTGGALLVTLGIAVTSAHSVPLVSALCDDNVPEFTVLRARH